MRKRLKKMVDKWRTWTGRIPRKSKVALYLLTCLVMGLLIYIFVGAPTYHWKHSYRRVEKAHFVGPAEILGYEEVSGLLYDEVVLAQTQDAVIVATISMYESENDILLYLPKNGKTVVTAAPQDPKRTLKTERTLTVFVVDDHPDAVYAELDLRIGNAKEDSLEGNRPQFHLSAQRQADGYFRMDLPLDQWEETSREYLSLMLLSEYSKNRERYNIAWELYDADVRFYDAAGNVIGEESLYLFEQKN